MLKNKTILCMILSFVLPLFISSCFHSESDVDSLAFDPNASNLIVIVMGDDSNIPGVHQDPPNLTKALMAPENNLGFTVHHQASSPMTKTEILNKTKEAAKLLLDTSENGTLFWYFTGHGDSNGDMVTNGMGMMSFNDVAQAIVEARGGKPLKRLIVLVDACYSGQVVDGFAQYGNGSSGTMYGLTNPNVAENTFALNSKNSKPMDLLTSLFGSFGGSMLGGVGSIGSAVGSAYNATLNGKVYEQGMIVSSSLNNELSGDSPTGGEGTTAFIGALTNLKQGVTNKNLTPLQVSNKTKMIMQNRGMTPRFMNVFNALFGSLGQGLTIGQYGTAMTGTVNVSDRGNPTLSDLTNVANSIANRQTMKAAFSPTSIGSEKIFE